LVYIVSSEISMKKAFRYLLAFLLFCPYFSNAQHLWEVGAFGGISNYEGGMAPDPVWKESHPAAGIFVKRVMNGYVSYSLGFNYGKISGKDSNSSYSAPRGLNFQSNIYELSTQMEFNFFNFGTKSDRDALRISPYIFIGLSLFHFDPMGEYNGKLYDLQNLATQGQGSVAGAPPQYDLTQVSIPIGGGVKFNLSEKFNLLILMGYRATFTTELDDVGPGNYPDPAQLPTRNNPMNIYFADPTNVGIPGQQRGNPDKRDWYLFTGISLSYIIPGRMCPYPRSTRHPSIFTD